MILGSVGPNVSGAIARDLAEPTCHVGSLSGATSASSGTVKLFYVSSVISNL